jgi:hypothetical protein
LRLMLGAMTVVASIPVIAFGVDRCIPTPVPVWISSSPCATWQQQTTCGYARIDVWPCLNNKSRLGTSIALTEQPHHASLPPWTTASRDGIPSVTDSTNRVIQTAYYDEAIGWPFLGFVATWINIFDNYQLVDGVRLPDDGCFITSGRRCVPLRPIWNGVLANWCIFAFLWALVIHCMVLSRKVMRRGRGHCAWCGYDVRASDSICPECGLSCIRK